MKFITHASLSLGFAMALVLPANSANTPVAAIEELILSLREHKIDPAENPAVALSPFCPPEKKQAYQTALEELATNISEGVASAELSVPINRKFAGGRIVLKHDRNPMQFKVLPICLLQTDAGWKAAAGLRHFQNTRFGYENGLVEASEAVATATVKDALQTQIDMVAASGKALWKQLTDIRSAWPEDASPDDHVRRFLDYDKKGDAIGKLACFYLPSTISPETLDKFLAILIEESHGEPPFTESGEESEVEASEDVLKSRGTYPFTVQVRMHELRGQICSVFGFLHAEDPTDHYTMPHFLKKMDAKRWLLVPHGYDVEGLPTPKNDLINWYDDSDEDLSIEAIQKFAELGRTSAPSGADRAEGAAYTKRYLDSLARQSFPEVLGMLLLPVADDVDDYDNLLNGLGEARDKFLPSGAPSPIIRSLAWREQGEFGGAIHAVYQPASSQPFFLNLQLAQFTKDGWRVIPSQWDGGPDSPATHADAQKVQQVLEAEWDTLKKDAILSLFTNQQRPTSKPDDDNQTIKDSLTHLLETAASGKFEEFLSEWAKPAGTADPLPALEQITRLGWQIRQMPTPPNMESLLIRGDLAGAIIPVPHTKREDGAQPARMILWSRSDKIWQPVPGFDFFRPINRGYKEINAKSLREAKARFDPSTHSDLDALATWLGSPTSSP